MPGKVNMSHAEGNSAKVVYVDLLGRVGSRVRQLIENPPAGYRLLSRARLLDQMAGAAMSVNSLWQLRHKLNRLVPVNLAAAYGPMRFKKPPNGVDLTYSESPLIFRREPWVVGVEVVIQFAGYDLRHLRRYRRIVERALGSPYCRAIICWSEASRQSIRRHLDASHFEQKLHVVYPAGLPKTFAKAPPANGHPVRILFVSSAVTPGKFQVKGGLDALEAFRALRQRYPHVELVLRCDVDRRIRQEWEGLPGLRILSEPLPQEELEKLYQQSDIFWAPVHTMMSVVMLEAMSYGVPVVTTNYYDNAEFVEDGRTGTVAPHRRNLPPWDTSEHEVEKVLNIPDPGFVRGIVEKTAVLVEAPELRRRLGRAARDEVENGKFSLIRKNQQLKSIFDQAVEEP